LHLKVKGELDDEDTWREDKPATDCKTSLRGVHSGISVQPPAERDGSSGSGKAKKKQGTVRSIKDARPAGGARAMGERIDTANRNSQKDRVIIG